MKYNKEELIKLREILEKMDDLGITLIRLSDVECYFNREECELIKKILSDPDFKKITEKRETKYKQNKEESIVEEAERILNYPYSVLEIEKREYTKEELLNILKDRMNKLQTLNYNESTKKEKQNEILDAYNILIKKMK